MKRIAIILGTRPEAIKLLPVFLKARARRDVEATLISTGQHRELVHDVMDLFQCRPDHDLNVMEPNQSLSTITSRILFRLDPILSHEIDLVVVQGDTTTAMVGAILSFYRNIPCAHVEAGLRSGDIQSPFPEEYNRRVVSLSAQWHFAPTQEAADNLAREGVTAGVHVVGNTSIDAALMIASVRNKPSAYLEATLPRLSELGRRYILVTAHRRENFGTRLDKIIAALSSIARSDSSLDVVWPVHPNPNVRDHVHRALKDTPNIYLIDPVRYDDLLYLLKGCFLVLTDSGGIQEEAPTFSRPVIVLRDTTERPEGVAAGCSVLAGTDTDNIIRHYQKISSDRMVYERMAAAKNPYGDGNASAQIIDLICSSDSMS